MSVVLRRTVWGDIDWHFDNLSGSHHQSQVNCESSVDRQWIVNRLSVNCHEIKYLDNVFNKNNYNRDFIRHNTYRNSEPNATNTNATPVTTVPYLTSKGLLKLSHESYNPTTSTLLTNLSLLYDSYWPTLKTKMNPATDGEQFIKSNATTAKPLILVRPTEI